MRASKETVKNSILFFAKLFGKEENYKAIMLEYAGLPKIVEMIVYEMFLERFNPYYCSTEEYENYKLLLEYASELKQNGFVTHDTN